VPARSEANRALLARVEELLGTYQRVRADVADARARAREVTGTAASPDGGVKVTVDQRGVLTGLEIDARTYRKSSPTELSATILELTAEAGAAARREMAQLMRPFLPRDLPFEDIIDGTADISALPGRPLTEESFDQWWSGIGRPAESD
jgi:DNA-binding protein YbaB